VAVRTLRRGSRQPRSLAGVGPSRGREITVDLAGFGPAALISARGRLGDRRAVEPLILVLDDESGGVRRAAAGALGAIGDRRALAALRAAQQDPDPSVGEEAARAVARIADGRPVGAL